jgi:hypothetical protein
MLTQLALGGKFASMAGFVFGRCTDCKATNVSLEDVLRDRFGAGPAPAISGLSFGHIDHKLTLPIGAMATLDADAGTLELLEGAVVCGAPKSDEECGEAPSSGAAKTAKDPRFRRARPQSQGPSPRFAGSG